MAIDDDWVMGELARDEYVPTGFDTMQMSLPPMPVSQYPRGQYPPEYYPEGYNAPPRKPDWGPPVMLPPDEKPEDYDLFERAAQRVRDAARKGERNEYPGQILGPVAHALGEPIRKGAGFLQAVRDANAELFPAQSGITSQTTDYEPTKAAIGAELPLIANLWGLGAASVPRASAGAFGTKLAAPAIIKQQHIEPLITKVEPTEFSVVKSQRVPTAELDAGRVFKSTAEPVAKSAPADLPIGSHVVSLAGDRTAMGELAAMEGKSVGPGHNIYGGADFIQSQSPKAVWANEPGAATGIQNKVEWLMNTTGQNAYGLYGPMGPISADFQPAIGKLALQGVRDVRGKLADETIAAFDNNMRRQWGGLKPGQKPDWMAVPDWPGITKTQRAIKFLENTTGGTRKKFGNMLDREAMTKFGMPNMSAIRHGFTSPEMANLPNYTYGRRVAQLSPEPSVGAIDHPAFGKNISGRSLGGWGYASPREVAFEDVVTNLQLQKEPLKRWDFYFGGRMPRTVPFHQEVTQRWIDANSAFGRNVSKMGELAALDDFSKRGLFFTGATDKKTGAALIAAANMPEINPPFYSAAQRALGNAKMTKGSPEQWLGYLRNQPGVKPEELELMFGNLPKGAPLTKAQMEAHAAENAVQIKEIDKGGGPAHQFGTQAEQDAAMRRYNEAHTAIINGTVGSPEYQLAVQEFADAQAAMRDIVPGWGRGPRSQEVPTKYESWQLPGGENYREKLLTLPKEVPAATKEAITKSDILARQRADAMAEWKGLAELNPPGHPDTLAAYKRLELIRRQEQDARATMEELTARHRDNQFRSSHWDEPNILAHVRTNEREIPPVAGGRNSPLRTLHIEEIQSDLHQKGRQLGYKNDNPSYTLEGNGPWVIRDNTGRFISDWNNKERALQHVDDLNTGKRVADQPGVPNLPFKSTWADLSLKRMIRDAVDKGKDAISWTPGKAQAERYDLSQHVKSIAYDRDEGVLLAYNKDGRQVIREYVDSTPEAMAEVIGKEPAQKLHEALKAKQYEREQWSVIKEDDGGRGRYVISDPNGEILHDYGGSEVSYRTRGEANEHIDDMLKRDAMSEGSGHAEISGLDLKIGGEGMHAFYDKMLVDKANAIGKKHGARVEEMHIPVKKKTDEGGVSGTMVMDDLGIDRAAQEGYWRGLSQAERDRLFAEYRTTDVNEPIYVLRITDALAEAARKGFPLFSAGGIVGGAGVMGGLADQNNYAQ